MRHHYPSVRVRLTLWNVGVMVVVLAVYAASVFVFVSRIESDGLDETLNDDYLWAVEMLDQGPDGTITWPTSDDSVTLLEGPWLQVWSPEGKELLYRTIVAERNPLPASDRLAREARSEIVLIPETTPPYRVYSVNSRIGDERVVIQVARSEFVMRRDLYQLLLVLLLGLPLGVAAAGLGGYSLARHALAPIERMAERARLITAERLQDRLPVDNPNDELGRLASVFNNTLTRLESSFEQMRQFTAHVSHELRTPLTAIRSVGEVGLRGKRSEPAYREIIGSMLEEVERLASLVERLLALSRAETSPSKLAVDAVDLCALAEDVRSQLDVLAEEKQQSITIDRVGTPTWTGDRLVLRQALMNLVDNAIKYSPLGGQITIRVAKSSAGVELDVRDTGPGIPEEVQARIFDRFYRVENSRSRDSGGTGLGLSIARGAVEVNGGRLTLEETDGVGSTFRITLPKRSLKAPFVPSSRAG